MLNFKISPNLAHFKDVKIERLGKINIITGKNNSGKTSILKQLGEKRDVITGTEFSFDVVDSLKNALRDLKNWGTTSRRVEIKISEILEVVKKHAENGIIYFDSKEKLIKDIEEFVFHDHNRHYVNKAVTSWFSSNIRSSYSAQYIPTKREINPNTQLVGDGDVSPIGHNLVNRLVYLSNGRPGSARSLENSKIQSLFSEVTNGLSFSTELNDNNNATLLFTNDKINYTPAEVCGLGLREVLLILYFVVCSNVELLCIDEIESHLHPEMQRLLVSVIEKNFKGTLLISTHSNVVVASASVSKVYISSVKGGRIHLDDSTSLANTLMEIGYSITENLVSDMILLVEGKFDIQSYQKILKMYDLIPRYNIKIWSLGGNEMNSHDLTVIKERNKVYAIIDKDPKSESIRVEFMENCEKLNIGCHRLQRYAFENYIPLSVYKETYGPSIIIGELDEIDPNIKVSDQIRQFEKRKVHRMVEKLDRNYFDGTDIKDAMKSIEELLRS